MAHDDNAAELAEVLVSMAATAPAPPDGALQEALVLSLQQMLRDPRGALALASLALGPDAGPILACASGAGGDLMLAIILADNIALRRRLHAVEEELVTHRAAAPVDLEAL